MSHAKNKVEWCLNKARRELQEGKKHRGLVKVEADFEKVTTLNITEAQESPETAVSIREEYQYSTKISLENKEYQELLELAKRILDKAKETLEMSVER